MVTLQDLQVRQLGECRHESALAKYVGGRQTNDHYVEENDRVLFDDTIALANSVSLHESILVYHLRVHRDRSGISDQLPGIID